MVVSQLHAIPCVLWNVFIKDVLQVEILFHGCLFTKDDFIEDCYYYGSLPGTLQTSKSSRRLLSSFRSLFEYVVC